VLIATLAMVLTIGAISVCLLELDSARLKRQVASIDNKRAFNLAEAGLAEAYHAIATGHTGNVGSKTAPAKFGDGLFWVESTELQPNTYGLESTGMAGSGRVTLSLVVRRKPGSIASLGVLGSEDVNVGASALLDGYDSSTGGAPGSESISLRSNGNITVGSLARVHGDATPGPESSVLLSLGATVTGSTAPGGASVPLPEIVVPEFEYGDDVVHTKPSTLLLDAKEMAASVLKVGSGAKVTLVGPSTVVVDQLIVEDGGTLEIDSTLGPVSLYVTDWVNLKSLSALSFPNQDTAGFTMQVTATGVRDRDGDSIADPAMRFLATGPFYGTLYVPFARVALPAGFAFYGAVSGERLVLGTSAQVHYDEALMSEGDGAGGSVELLSWRIVEVPVEIARDLAEDPFAILAVDKNALLAPADSLEAVDNQIGVKYIDLGNVERTYRGPESGFDWGSVKLVIQLVRIPV
jgi:hypothetical protein